MEGRDHETLTEPSTLAGEESILNPCMSNTSNAATERQDVVNQELFSEAEPTSEKESKPTTSNARSVFDDKRSTLSLPQGLTPSLLFDAFRKSFSRPDDELQKAVHKSNEIDREIERDRAYRDRITKVLLLGMGGGGKCTLLKQMTRLLKGPFSIDERKKAQENILVNLIQGCQVIIGKMDYEKVEFDTPESEHAARIIEAIETTNPFPHLSTECCNAIGTLAKDRGFWTTFQGAYGLAYYDTMTHFLKNLDFISQSDYTPTDTDMLLTKTRIFGISETYLRRESTKQDFFVYDLGGAQGERKKWIHVFDDVDIVVVVASIDTYYQCLVEDQGMTLMQETLTYFESIFRSTWFKQITKIVVLLTKLDHLADLLKQYPVKSWWPDYTGDPQSETEVVQFFTDKFLAYKVNKERPLVVEALSLLDTKAVFQFLEDEILKPRV